MLNTMLAIFTTKYYVIPLSGTQNLCQEYQVIRVERKADPRQLNVLKSGRKEKLS